LSITSGVDYEIDLFLRLDSTSLQFPEAERCPRSTNVACLRVKLRPRTQTIEVEVIAEATGTGALNVSLLTPRRGVVIDSSRLFIRSTAYNVVGVSITVGAAAFLILWWFVGLLRRRIKPANA
jgi:hypothetical protein